MGLAVIALLCLLYSVDLTVLNLAVPHLSADQRPSSSQLLWIVDIYGFVIAGAPITMGTLGDRIGRRRLLLIGAAVFGLASMLAAFSTSAAMLIAARAVLGLAAATLAPSTLSLIRNMFHDPHERTVAISAWIASFPAGSAIGPLLGGALLAHFCWGSVFLLNVPVMLFLLGIGPVLLPQFRDPDARRFGLLSAALSPIAVLAAIYGVKRMADGMAPHLGRRERPTLGALFVRRQLRLEDPLIDLRLFRSPAFSASLAVNVLGFFVSFGVFDPQYLQLVLGMGPLSKPVCGPRHRAQGSSSAPSLAPVIVRLVRPAYVVAAGLVLAAIRFAVLTQVRLQRTGGARDWICDVVPGSCASVYVGDRSGRRDRPTRAGRRRVGDRGDQLRAGRRARYR